MLLMEMLKIPPHSESLADGVVQALHRGISEGALDPQETYSVYQLAETLGVSRSPVREGLLRMAQAGLVEIRKNRGFRVILPRKQDIEEIFEIRLALEPPAARRASEVGTNEQFFSLRQALDKLATTVRNNDRASFWAADRALHVTLLKMSGNRRIIEIIQALRENTSLLGPPTTASGRSLTEILADHEPVVTAVLARDGNRAEKAMRTHLQRTGELLANNIREVDPCSACQAGIHRSRVSRVCVINFS